jgi:RNA methyltransferase, TrmH family
MSLINPLSKSLVKEFSFLKQKKYRQKYNKFVVEGEKMVSELLATYPDHLVCIIVRNDFAYAHRFEKSCPVYSVSNVDLDRISSMITPPPVLAVVHILPSANEDVLLNKHGLFLYLDRIKDPGNMGTIIRSLNWFGGSGLFISPDSVDIYNPKVVQASMGSLFGIPIIIMPFEKVYTLFTKEQMACLDMNGEDCRTAELADRMLFVVGSESQGISKSVKGYIDRCISIPSGNSKDQIESLNASVAASLITYEYMRRKSPRF